MKRAIPALVLAIIAMAIGWMGYGGFIFGIPALILGILAVRDAGASRTVGIIGIVFACIGIAESVAAVAFIAAVTESTSPREVTGAAGTEVRVGNWGVIVSEPIYTSKFYERGLFFENDYRAFTPTAGYQFALVKMKVINRGVEENSPDFYDIKLVTTEGLKYESKYGFELKSTSETYAEPPSPLCEHIYLSSVLPREYVEGYLYFEIPSGAKADSLTFKSGILPETDVVIKF
jgi:hypothetical protein